MTDNNHIPIITRKQAKELGLTRYFTGIPCKSGHVVERITTMRACSLCVAFCEKKWLKANPEKRKAKERRWREKNPDKVNYYCRKSKQKCKDKIRERRRKNSERINAVREIYKEKNKERMAVVRRAHRERNKERNSLVYKEYRKNNPDKMYAKDRRKRIRKKNASGSHSFDDIKSIMEAQKCKCVYCKSKIAFNPSNGELKAHVDHIVALSKGGSNAPNNLQMLCWRCNISKGAKDHVDFARQFGLLL